MRTILSYDGSFEGFLTAIFTVYEERISHPTIQPIYRCTETFFDTVSPIITDPKKAQRVWKGITQYCSKNALSNIYRAFLSEKAGIEDVLLHFIKRSLSEKKHLENDFGDAFILEFSKVVKMVGREKHRMDAFVRFRETKDGLYVATVSPDFNVLPLLKKHFTLRYADQRWLIYDLKRNFGIYYNLTSTSEVILESTENIKPSSKECLIFTQNEMAFEELWVNYYNSTNIVSRKNTKLHLRHVPKRYWKYLSEKSHM